MNEIVEIDVINIENMIYEIDGKEVMLDSDLAKLYQVETKRINEAGTGQDMILIHGRGYSKENMKPLFNYYKGKCHVISYDVRGHGESDKPEKFSLEDHVKDLKGIVEEYNLVDPIVIGFSMGSYIALKTAETYPDLFSKIVLIGTKGTGKTSSIQKINEENKNKKEEDLFKIIRKKIFAPHVTLEQIQEFDKEIASSVVLTKEQNEAIDKALQNFDLIEDANKVLTPVLVMTGEYDGLNPVEEGKKVADALPNSTFEMIQNAGHIAFFENKEQVLSLINHFITN